MSMKVLTVLQFISIFTIYTGLFIAVPHCFAPQKLKDEIFSVRFFLLYRIRSFLSDQSGIISSAASYFRQIYADFGQCTSSRYILGTYEKSFT